MRALLMLCLLAGTASAQTGMLGVFTRSDDVGAPPLKESATFDAAAGHYRA